MAGQSIPHFHPHIVPRKQGDEGITEYEPRKFLYRPGSRETSPEDELQTVAKEIGQAIIKQERPKRRIPSARSQEEAWGVYSNYTDGEGW